MKLKLTILMLGLTLATTAAMPASNSDPYSAWKNRPNEPFSEPEANFNKVKTLLLTQYFDSKLTEQDLYRAAVQGMLSSLNSDDHAWNKLLSPTELNELEGDMKGEITGIGIEMKFDPAVGIPDITGIVPGTAAEKAGLKPGDLIVSVNGRLYKGLQMRDVVYDIRGKAGEKVRLKVLRGDEVVSKTITREKLSWSPVDSRRLDGDIGYVSVRYFAESTPKLLSDALTSLGKEPLKGLILDLRENSGGLFTKAIESAELLVPSGAVVVNVVDRDRKSEAVKSSGSPLLTHVPIVIITSHETASGAELFAASLADNLGARIVGDQTLGKWNAQDLEKLSNDYAVKFTIKQFLSPKGKSYQNVGLTPDVPVSGDSEKASKPGKLESDSRLRAAVNLLRG